MTMRVPLVLLCAATLLWACSDTGGTYYPPDGPTPKLDSAGTGVFLAPCTVGIDCLSGSCVDFGGSVGKRCSQPCGSQTQCPQLGGWSCDEKLQACRCTATGAQPTVCGVDGDCDGQADRPVEVETCNDKDDDCNGLIDDVPAGTTGAELYYEDKDGDGFGNVGKPKWLCKAQPGWVEDNRDCDDNEKLATPDGVEICGDKIDNNCDGRIEDPDVCGLTPIVVPSIDQGLSAQLKLCDLDGTISEALDVKEIVAKQDATVIKFTVRLRGAPSTTSCSSYKLNFGSATKADDVVYVYRPAVGACAGLAELAAYHLGQPMSTTATVGFNAASPGHVAFTIPKSEIFGKIPDPSYQLRACSNAVADATKDITDCSADSCDTPVHR